MAKAKRKGTKGKGPKGKGAKPGGREALRNTYIDRLAKIWQVRADQAERMASVALQSSIRLNPFSPLAADDTLARLDAFGADLAPIAWCPGGYHLISDNKRELAESDLFTQGHVFIQNASSFIPPLAMAPQAGDRILDVCAAPGGKTAHIQALAGGRADIVANDAMKPRLEKLHDVLNTLRVENVRVTNFQGQFIDRHLDDLGGQLFDRILLDAQCSGEGMLDLSHPGALRFWSLDRITKMAYLQQKMLTAAWKLLKPGGVLVYSTCTFGPEENEAPIARHLKHHEDARVMPIDFDGADAIAGRAPGLKSWDGQTFPDALQAAVRVLPSTHLEGFFVCRLVKLD